MGKLHPELHNHLAELRTAQGLTQEQLAKAANVSRQTIIAIEGGAYSPSTVLALRLAFLLDASLHELFELTPTSIIELQQQRDVLRKAKKEHLKHLTEGDEHHEI